ncbi:unnamed protein product, partial [Mesorhabditis belari]|uniref:Hexosyltransferase n=1 Tax=Mesorhabditis belari TaxID=2138241 RepID=A0AAF3FGW6_9BILA
MVFRRNSLLFLIFSLIFVSTSAQNSSSFTQHGSPLFDPMPIRLSPSVCTSETQTVIIVHSSVANFERREVIRKTYGEEKYRKKYGYEVIFVTGRKAENVLFDKWIHEESNQHEDILQGDFIDSYENITIKGLLWLRYVSVSCPWSSFVLHLDDDIIFDVNQIFMQLIDFKLDDNSVICLTTTYQSGEIVRDPKARWFVSYTAFSEDTYPAYCAGAAYLLLAERLPGIIREITKYEYIPIDDVVITGIARKRLDLNIHQVYPEAILRKDEDTVTEYFLNGWAVVGECLTIQCMTHIWRLITSNMTKRGRISRWPVNENGYNLFVISSILLATEGISAKENSRTSTTPEKPPPPKPARKRSRKKLYLVVPIELLLSQGHEPMYDPCGAALPEYQRIYRKLHSGRNFKKLVAESTR